MRADSAKTRKVTIMTKNPKTFWKVATAKPCIKITSTNLFSMLSAIFSYMVDRKKFQIRFSATTTFAAVMRNNLLSQLWSNQASTLACHLVFAFPILCAPPITIFSKLRMVCAPILRQPNPIRCAFSVFLLIFRIASSIPFIVRPLIFTVSRSTSICALPFSTIFPCGFRVLPSHAGIISYKP